MAVDAQVFLKLYIPKNPNNEVQVEGIVSPALRGLDEWSVYLEPPQFVGIRLT
jgi:hypothetical protein